MFTRGDIVIGNDRRYSAAKHPIIYLEGDLSVDFIGVMLTSSSTYSTNIWLPEEYVISRNEHGDLYVFQHKNTHFVSIRLLKPISWGPFKKVGKITEQGILFIEKEINNIQPIYWDDFLKQTAL
jgi:hypothetical protein